MRDFKNICADSIVGLVEMLERETGAPNDRATKRVREWCDRVLAWKPGQTKECDECGGSGQVEDYSDGPNRAGYMTCDECDGQKIIEIGYPRI